MDMEVYDRDDINSPGERNRRHDRRRRIARAWAEQSRVQAMRGQARAENEGRWRGKGKTQGDDDS